LLCGAGGLFHDISAARDFEPFVAGVARDRRPIKIFRRKARNVARRRSRLAWDRCRRGRFRRRRWFGMFNKRAAVRRVTARLGRRRRRVIVAGDQESDREQREHKGQPFSDKLLGPFHIATPFLYRRLKSRRTHPQRGLSPRSDSPFFGIPTH
jgi:hypothetical protein